MNLFSRLPIPARTLGVLLASLLGGTIISAATVGTTSGTVLSGTYSLTQDVSSGFIVYQGSSGGTSTSGAMFVGGLDSTSGVPVSYSYTLPIELGSGPIAFLGLDSAGGVTLTANNSVAPSYVGSPWPYAQTEAHIASDLLQGNTVDLVAFINAHSGDFFYSPGTTQATFLAFSNGQPIGSMSLTANTIPEPRTAVLLLAGFIVVACLASGREVGF